MLIRLRNPLYRLMAFGVSLLVIAIVYFAVLKPREDRAASAAQQGERQLNQAVQKAAKSNPGAVPARVQNLAACIAAAGTDSSKLLACAAKFKQ
jgi:type II secretory pathway component PulM